VAVENMRRFLARANSHPNIFGPILDGSVFAGGEHEISVLAMDNREPWTIEAA
jgi:hypothetical protein